MLANCTINCNLIGPYLPPSPSSDVVYFFMLKGSTIQHCICRDMWKYKKIPKPCPVLTNRGRKLRKYPILPNTPNHAKQILDIWDICRFWSEMQPCFRLGFPRSLCNSRTWQIRSWQGGCSSVADNKLLIQSSFGDTREGLPQQMTFVLPTNDASCHHFLSSLTCPT